METDKEAKVYEKKSVSLEDLTTTPFDKVKLSDQIWARCTPDSKFMLVTVKQFLDKDTFIVKQRCSTPQGDFVICRDDAIVLTKLIPPTARGRLICECSRLKLSLKVEDMALDHILLEANGVNPVGKVMIKCSASATGQMLNFEAHGWGTTREEACEHAADFVLAHVHKYVVKEDKSGRGISA
jgi:hypothetical protein